MQREFSFSEIRHYKDGQCLRCTTPSCEEYRKRSSIRKESFFIGLNLLFLKIIKVLIRWSSNNSNQADIVENLGINSRTYKKIIGKFLNLVGVFDFKDDKLGGPGTVVQIDETALNHKVKSHRGRSLRNKTDALCIVEFTDHITRALATAIPDKKATTIVPIIQDNVVSNSIIHTDEHKSYSSLNKLNFYHDTVCHKKGFINHATGARTQAVESFNNCINLGIKKGKE
jgi:transposase-like protein